MKNRINLFYAVLLAMAFFIGVAGAAGTDSGELRQWHKVTVTFSGPSTSETGGTNPPPGLANKALEKRSPRTNPWPARATPGRYSSAGQRTCTS